MGKNERVEVSAELGVCAPPRTHLLPHIKSGRLDPPRLVHLARQGASWHVHEVVRGDDVVHAGARRLGPALESALGEGVTTTAGRGVERSERSFAEGGLLGGNLLVARLDAVRLGGEEDFVGVAVGGGFGGGLVDGDGNPPPA